MSKTIFVCMLSLAGAARGLAADQKTVEIPGIVRIDSNVPVAPPGWAALERRLLNTLSEAAVEYTARYVRSGGTLIWKTSGGASLDDLPESFYNIPLLYALGGTSGCARFRFGSGTPPHASSPMTFPFCTTNLRNTATGSTWEKVCFTSTFSDWSTPPIMKP